MGRVPMLWPLLVLVVVSAVDQQGWGMTGKDARRSYAAPPSGERRPVWAFPYVKALGQDMLYAFGQVGVANPQHIADNGVLYYQSGSSTVTAFVINSNSTLWQHSLADDFAAYMEFTSNLALSTDGSQLYAFMATVDGSSSVISLNSSNGALLWASLPASCVDDTGATSPVMFLDSPVIHPITGSLVAVASCGPRQAILYSLRGSFSPSPNSKTVSLTALTEWNTSVALDSTTGASAPVVSTDPDLILYARVEPSPFEELSPYNRSHSLIAVHPSNGTVMWKAKIPAPSLPSVSSVTQSGIVVITSFLPSTSSAQFETLLYSIREGRMVNDRLPFQLNNTAVAAIGSDDSLFAVSRDNTTLSAELLRIATADADFGRVLWRWNNGGKWVVRSSALTPRLSVDGNAAIYVYDEGSVYAIHAATGHTLWGKKVWRGGSVLGGPVSLSPVIATSANGDKTQLVVEVDFNTLTGVSYFGVLDCCSGNGQCIYNETSGARCECQPNFVKPDCSAYCDAHACAIKGPHFACSQDSGQCECTRNWFPQGKCSVFCNVSQCSQLGPRHVCSDRGCVCEEHYYGTNCSVRCDAAKDCSGHGQCGSDGKCVCPSAWWLGPYSYASDNCERSTNPRFITFVCALAGGVLLTVLAIVAITYWRWWRNRRSLDGDEDHEYEYSIVGMD